MTRLPHGWQDWARFEARGGFIVWAEDAPTDSCGERYAVVRYCGGIHWARVSPNPDVPVQYSSGCFYDDMPGGAVEAAKRGTMTHRAKLAKLLAR